MYEIKCKGNCGNIILSSSPERTYNWATKDMLICDNCQDIISGDAGRDK